MPYLLQDQWTCEREPTDVPVIAYENDRLKLSITPQWGARIWSVYDKVLKRDWTFANPAHQPANIGVLKSWSAGGIEFNWSPGIIGHSVYAESPAYVGILETERGPVLRAYEYDRRNQSVWQSDIWLAGVESMSSGKGAKPAKPTKKAPAASPVPDNEDLAKLWVHPKVTNTQAAELQGYWWTCVAVPAAPTTRVITPAEWNLETSSDESVGSPWPVFSMGNDNASFVGKDGTGMTDNSFLEAIWSGDFFMGPLDRADSPVNYISYAEEGGFVGFHGHPLNGTKFFTWGQSGAGRFMQDFLGGRSAADTSTGDVRSGDYAELQVGPAFTQFQTFDLPESSTIEWTEFFGAFEGDAATLQSTDYGVAVGAVEGWLVGADGVNDTAFLGTDEWLASIADTPLDAVLSAGSPWGAVEEIRREALLVNVNKNKNAPAAASAAGPGPYQGGLRRGARTSSAQLAPGLTFDHDAAWANPETRPWCELASDGAFSGATLASQPLSYQIGDEWLDLLIASEQGSGGKTWLHDLHVATALAERGDVDEPKARFASSLASQPVNPVAARNLAVLQTSFDDAWPYFQQAFAAALQLASNTSTGDVAAVNAGAGKRLLVNLGSEMCVLLQGAAQWDSLKTFLDSEDFAAAAALNPALPTLDTVLLSRALLALRLDPQDPDAALAILGAEGPAGCFPTFGKVRRNLMSLWFEAKEALAAAAKGSALLPVEARNIRIANPVPRNIGCPYADWSGANQCTYW